MDTNKKDEKDKEKGKMTVEEAGKKGGEKTSETHGSEFYSKIGQKGGETVSQDREHMADIGKKGGKAQHSRDDEKKNQSNLIDEDMDEEELMEEDM